MSSKIWLTFLLLTGCATHLTRGPAGWALDKVTFTIEPTHDGRLMPDGWLLQHFVKAGQGHFTRRVEPEVDLSFSRSRDDGWLAIDEATAPRSKTMRTLADRFIADLRTREVEVSGGRFRATVEVDEPIEELAGSPLSSEGIDGYELVVTQRHVNETAPFRTVYFALVRAADSPTVITIFYVNSPSAFLDGLAEARQLTRRVKLAGASLSRELPALETDPKKLPPGAPIRL